MEPLLLVCGGCGGKIRVVALDHARTRSCPRCASPLGSAVVKPLPARSVPNNCKSETLTEEGQVNLLGKFPGSATNDAPTVRPTLRRARWVFTAAALLFGSTLIHLAIPVEPMRIGVGSNSWLPPDRLVVSSQAHVARSALLGIDPRTRCDRLADAEVEGFAEADDNPSASPAEPLRRPDLGSPSLALRDPQVAVSEPMLLAPPSTSGTSSVGLSQPSSSVASKQVQEARSVAATALPTSPTPAAPRCLLVRDADGKAVVAREHGMMKDQMAVVLPDGTIGWPTTQVFTDQPFVPSTIDDLERTLQTGEYATFRVIKTEHYLIFYQSSERFARDSADLLEKLHEKLTGVLRKQKLAVNSTEFPLVAVIFRSETDFRANREVARDVQAYYEILSNRIFFFEKGTRDNASPEVSAFRKPQTVAHEGTHQLLHNVGIQPRMAPWPLWLVEGLAEYCSPPRTTKKGGLIWDGIGQVNPIHMATIADLDDPMSSEVRGGPRAPTARDRGQPLVEYLVTRSDLTPTDYALSWGLTHYLALERVDQFVAYIRKLNQLRPFETRTPEQQLADFREVFGGNLAKLDAQVAKHLSRLKVPEAQALPFYAMLVEQQMPRGAVRRMAMVSQSPSVIRQWFDTATNSEGGSINNWKVVPHPNRTRAILTADTWIQEGQ